MIIQTLLIALLCCANLLSKQLTLAIVTPTYNNTTWCVRNIQSVVSQTYQHWHMTIINDASTDDTSEKIHAFVQQHNLAEKITIIDNPVRKGALHNLYDAIHHTDDHHVILTLDGDDWLATDFALEQIAQAYDDESVWMTYGQFMWYPVGAKGFCRPFPPEIMHYKQFRSYYWISSHPRTFYAWLFKKIEKEDLLYEGKFLPMTWDVAMMLPMLEMASDGHVRCLEEILYVYNDDNPLNDHKKDLDLQRKLSGYIAEKPTYPTLLQPH